MGPADQPAKRVRARKSSQTSFRTPKVHTVKPPPPPSASGASSSDEDEAEELEPEPEPEPARKSKRARK